MRDAQKPDHISLTNLVNRLREGRFVIPDFQREFEWKPGDIAVLMRSIFLDYYIGSLLLWKGKEDNFEALACEPIFGFEGSSSREHIVLDGQQRLTAIHYAFLAPDQPLPGKKNRFLYFIRVDRFMEEEYDEAFTTEFSQRGRKLLDDDVSQFETHYFPLAVIGRDGWALAEWAKGYEAHWAAKAAAATAADDEVAATHAAQHVANAQAFGKHLRGITDQYQVAFIELDRELAIEKVCDIFTQINSRGIRLDVFDLINALLKPKGVQLKSMWRDAKSKLNFVETERLNVYVLQVMSIVAQSYCSPKYLYFLLPGQEKAVREPDGSLRKKTLIADTHEFKLRWSESVAALGKAIKLLQHPQEFGVISATYLPYVSILPAFASLHNAIQSLPPERQLDALRKFRHWYWASVFLNKYSGSVESTTARDYIGVKGWYLDDTAEPGLIAEFEARFRSVDLRKEIKRGTSVYSGIFNLLVINGARDWMAGTVPQYDDLDDHHIVPKSWGQENGLGADIDTILNRTPLTANTNRHVINDRLPNAYLPELIAASGESAVRAILESHFISPTAFDILMRDPFTKDDYEDFVNERQRTLREAIEDLLIKERLDLAPQLRELDASLERVELSLRSSISRALDNDPAMLPSHVSKKVSDRLQIDAKKNPAFEAEKYEALDGQLEFCDLRELQDTITSKPLWSRFEAQFGTKEQLATRFGQLAELRNGIRHSRSVSEVARKEGEAAILWFDQVLAKAKQAASP